MRYSSIIVKNILVISAFVLAGLPVMGSYCSEYPTEVLKLARHQASPLWSKDGSHVIFAHPPAGLFVVDSSGSDMSSLPPGLILGTHRLPGGFSPALSFDGSRVACVTVEKSDWGNYNSEIVTSALDGSSFRRLTNDSAIDANPAWSPDGSRIAFMSGRPPSYRLYVMDSDGSNVRGLAPSIVSRGHPPVWSLDGRRIAFVSFQSDFVKIGEKEREIERYIVHTVLPDGSGLIELGDTVSNPVWSPDGGRIAFMHILADGTHGLYTVNGDGTDPRMLLFFERDIDWGERSIAWYHTLSWSPGGLRILFGSSSSGFFKLVTVDPDISKAMVIADFPPIGGSTIAMAGGGIEMAATVADFPPILPKLTTPAVGGATWSPDGSRIAFYISVGDYLLSPSAGLYTTARDGSDKRILVRGTSERLVAVHSDWRNVTSSDVAACSGGYVVPKPGKTKGLVRDCEILLRARESLAGEVILNWSRSTPITEWQGVGIADSPPRVKRLFLPDRDGQELTGIIPPELSKLSELDTLNLDSNRLTGSIPPELGNLSKLDTLNLDSNRLTGSIPPELGNLSKLDTLNLDSNRLTGSIPPELGNLINLLEADLSHNQLTGNIPGELGNLTNLERLDLSYNRLEGAIPPELAGLTNLSGLSIEGNNMT